MFRRQLGTLLYKNWLIQRRKWMWTLMELFLPLALTGTLLAVNKIIAPKKYPDKTYDPVIVNGDSRDFRDNLVDGFEMVPFFGAYFNPQKLHYAPNTTFINEIMNRVRRKLSQAKFWDEKSENLENCGDFAKNVYNDKFDDSKSNIQITGYSTGQEMEKALYELLITYYPSTFYAGIVFSEEFAQGKTKNNAQYQLRFTYEQRNFRPDENAGGFVYSWSTDKDFSEDFTELNPNQNSSDGGIPNYWREGFLTLQRAIDSVLSYTMEPKTLCSVLTTSVTVQRFPYPAYVSHPLLGILPLLLPAILVLSFVVSSLYITRSLTVEKETKLVEYVSIITGLSPWLQSLAHLIVNAIKLFLVAMAMTLMLCLSVLENSNPVLIGLFLLLYILNVLTFSFIVATFFNSVNNATLCSGVLWFLMYIPCLYLQTKFNSFQRVEIFSFGILPNAAVVVFSQIVSYFESQGKGLQWDTFLNKPFVNAKIAIYECYVMLLISLLPPIILRMFVSFCHVIWITYSDTPMHHKVNDASQPIRFDAKRVEQHADFVKPSISVEKAYKVYSNGRSSPTKALSNFSLNVLPGELTIILGHNGAGKSTLMNVLTGITTLTNGSAYIQNYDVMSEMQRIRKIIGYCPQYNMLFDQLTVTEHLQFFSKLRQVEYDNEKARYLMKRLNIWEKRHEFSKHLSGGQKRRLCLAISLVNGAKVILLDEATSGMDPGAKGDILELIKHEKCEDRTFVLVTHYVDEAETLGDRIAIVANGQLQCCGTNMFLKNRFGNGYRLSLRFKHTINENLQLFVDKILNIIHESCPGAAVLNFCGTQVQYLLCPLNNASSVDCSDIRTMMEMLEGLKSRLPIDSFSISMPTMQDVFMK